MTINDFWNEFDDQGRYRQSEGALDVVFATRGGGRFPGKFHFDKGLCVKAGMAVGGDWARDDGSPLHGVKFLLSFADNLHGLAIDQGRVAPLDNPELRSTKRDFLSNFRVARNLFVHPLVESDSSHINTGAIASTLSRSAIWLTPKSVAGFVASDFAELGLERQNELLAAVQSFLTVAREVAPDRPATEEQVGNASVAFLKILEILSPYLAQPEEATAVEKALRKVEFPTWVVNWDYELGSDADGLRTVWVRVFADGEVIPKNALGPASSELTNRVRQAFGEAGINRWPYVRLVTAREYKAG